MRTTTILIDESHDLMGRPPLEMAQAPSYPIPRSGRLLLRCSGRFSFRVDERAKALGFDAPNAVVLFTKNGQYQANWAGLAVLGIDLDIPPPRPAGSVPPSLGPQAEGDRLLLMIGCIDRTPEDRTKGGIVLMWMGSLAVETPPPPIGPGALPGPSGTRTFRMLIHDGLRLVTGRLSPSNDLVASYYRIPSTWFDGDGLLPDLERRLFEERFAGLYGGPGWRCGNHDGSCFVVLGSILESLDDAEEREEPWKAAREGLKVMGCFHVAGGRLVSVPPGEF